MNTEFNDFEKELKVNEISKSYLLETAKWTKFIAIIGFIGIGFLVLAGVMFAALSSVNFASIPGMENLGALGGTFVAIIYIVLALIYYFPVKYLYDFSVKVKEALAIVDPVKLEEALEKLKSHYKYIGILLIVVLCFYALIFVFAIFAAIFASFN